jgi:hypothetical protein
MTTTACLPSCTKTHGRQPAGKPAGKDAWKRARRRYSWKLKLKILDPRARVALTARRLKCFQRLFAFRYTDGIVTRVGQGPRAWTRLKSRMDIEQVARHLLADRAPGLQPQWVGARSLPHSKWVCLDVDADRTPEQRLTDEGGDISDLNEDELAYQIQHLPPIPSRPPFTSRCQQVEAMLAKLGWDCTDPDDVLIQETPRGGRHYYIFFDRPYPLTGYKILFNGTGLKFGKGEIELYPSETQGLRLPFGHLPGRPRDPRTWIDFTDRYRSGQIRQHNLKRILASRTKHHRRVRKPNAPAPTANQAPTRPHPGTPRRLQTPSPAPITGAVNRYRELTDRGPKSVQEAEELLQLGILIPGTRTAALKHLAAHLIWFKQLAPEAAAQQLAVWALNPRHDSKDIQDDLRHGTSTVADHIHRMCQWYAAHRDASRSSTPGRQLTKSTTAIFTADEIEAIRGYLATLPVEDRRHQAEFYLHFLAFAKRHGRPAQDSSGWEAAPAINAVVRKWPGCSHTQYRDRINQATEAGGLKIVRNKWQNPNGPGRARTYRLHVPVTPAAPDTIDYRTALELLAPAARIGVTGKVVNPAQEDRNTQTHQGNHDGDDPARSERILPPAVHQASPRGDLDPGPRERDAQPDAPPRVRDPNPAAVAADPTRPASSQAAIKRLVGWQTTRWFRWKDLGAAGRNAANGPTAELARLEAELEVLERLCGRQLGEKCSLPSALSKIVWPTGPPE